MTAIVATFLATFNAVSVPSMMEAKTWADMQPRYEHDCECCQYMGRSGEFDVYTCVESGEVINRFGSEGPDYSVPPREYV